MSATTFERHRRAVAAQYVREAIKRSGGKKKFAEVVADIGLNPDNLGTLEDNTDVRTIADRLKAAELDEPELDSLEKLGTAEQGPRAAVHSPDVRKDQFEDRIQHASQETVGVGNMHDGPQAAEDLANVGRRFLALPGVDGDLTKAAAIEAYVRSPLARGTGGRTPEGGAAPSRRGKKSESEPAPALDLATEEGVQAAIAAGEKILAEEAKALPEVHPSSEPAADAQNAPAATEDGQTGPIDPALMAESLAETASEDSKPTDPEGTQEGVASTPVDHAAEAEKAQGEAEANAEVAEAAEDAIASLDRDQLIAYASNAGLDIGPVKERDTPATIRKRITAALDARKAEGVVANG